MTRSKLKKRPPNAHAAASRWQQPRKAKRAIPAVPNDSAVLHVLPPTDGTQRQKIRSSGKAAAGNHASLTNISQPWHSTMGPISHFLKSYRSRNQTQRVIRPPQAASSMNWLVHLFGSMLRRYLGQKHECVSEPKPCRSTLAQFRGGTNPIPIKKQFAMPHSRQQSPIPTKTLTCIATTCPVETSSQSGPLALSTPTTARCRLKYVARSGQLPVPRAVIETHVGRCSKRRPRVSCSTALRAPVIPLAMQVLSPSAIRGDARTQR